jgi:hypothetical protein
MRIIASTSLIAVVRSAAKRFVLATRQDIAPTRRHNMLRLLTLALCLSSVMHAQIFAHLDDVSNSLKVSRGYIVGWEVGSNAQHIADQIRIYDRRGTPVTRISMLPLVPEATGMDINDVAISPTGVIVVAATYSAGPGTLPSSVLLYFDLHGQLQSAVGLLPSRQITKLVVDEESNVWTLTESTTGKDPSTVPMLVEYDSSGHVVRELLKRSQFPADADIVHADIGMVGFGYVNGAVWFWTPASQDLVTVDVHNGSFTRVHTGMPNKSPAETPMGTHRDGDTLVSLILGAPKLYSPGTWGIFRWSPTQGWSKIEPVECQKQKILLRDMENGKGIFARSSQDRGMDVCMSDFQ